MGRALSLSAAARPAEAAPSPPPGGAALLASARGWHLREVPQPRRACGSPLRIAPAGEECAPPQASGSERTVASRPPLPAAAGVPVRRCRRGGGPAYTGIRGQDAAREMLDRLRRMPCEPRLIKQVHPGQTPPRFAKAPGGGPRPASGIWLRSGAVTIHRVLDNLERFFIHVPGLEALWRRAHVEPDLFAGF